MAEAAPVGPPPAPARGADEARPGVLHGVENGVLCAVLAAMVLLPVAEIVLRRFATGIEAVVNLTQHMVLAVACLGGAIAAREQRLLSYAAFRGTSKPFLRRARLASYAFSAALCVVFCIGTAQFVLLEREGGQILAYGVPTWVFEVVQPVGFALIAWRLLRHSGGGPLATAIAFAVSAAGVAAFAAAPVDPAGLVAPALAALLVATAFGAPIFVAVGGAALILLWGEGVPVAALAVNQYALVAMPSLPTIPMFTLAGFFLAESGAPGRLVEVFESLFGQFRGGAALVTVLAATFFTSFTGASGVTIIALGGLILPLLLRSGYRDSHALALITGGGSAGVLLVPALPLLLYAIIAGIDLEAMLLGGLLPAVLIFALIAGWGMRQQPADAEKSRFSWRRARAAIVVAKWELALPLVTVGAMFSGLATPVEAAAITALYAFVVSTFIHRDLHLVRDVPRVVAECGLLVGGILLILGMALGLTNYLVDAQLTTLVVEWVTGVISNPLVFLLALNAFLLIAGCVMDIYSAIFVLVPLVAPLGVAYGIHPIHLGLVFLANLELGYLTPPVGMNLFFAASRFNRPVLEVCRSVLPIFALLCAGVLIITYVPFLSTALPSLLE